MSEQEKNQKIFFIRLLATVLAMVLIMYLAKVWFVEPLRKGSASPELSQIEQPVRKSVEEVSRDFHSSKTEERSSPIKVISWDEADRYYGQKVTVEGRIVSTYNSGKACFLNFHTDYKRYLTAVIFASAFPRFPSNPQNYYRGKKVRITGVVKEYQGKPEIILNYPDQIEILD